MGPDARQEDSRREDRPRTRSSDRRAEPRDPGATSHRDRHREHSRDRPAHHATAKDDGPATTVDDRPEPPTTAARDRKEDTDPDSEPECLGTARKRSRQDVRLKSAVTVAPTVAVPPPYVSAAGTYESHPRRGRLPHLFDNRRQVGSAGKSVRGTQHKGRQDTLRAGWDIPLVGQMPVCHYMRKGDRRVYGCPALGCSIVRSDEASVLGHYVLTHCYSATVYWCDGPSCDAAFVSRTAADDHRQVHRRDRLSREIGEGKIIQMEGDSFATLWTAGNALLRSPSEIREKQALLTLRHEGIMEERFARYLGRQGYSVPAHRVYPGPPGTELLPLYPATSRPSPTRPPPATTRSTAAQPAAAAGRPTETFRAESPPILTRELPTASTGRGRSPVAPERQPVSLELPAPLPMEHGSPTRDMPPAPDADTSGLPAYADLIAVDPQDVVRLLGADFGSDGEAAIILGAAGVEPDLAATETATEAQAPADTEVEMDTYAMGQQRLEDMEAADAETTGRTVELGSGTLYTDTDSQVSESPDAQGHLDMLVQAAELGRQDRHPAEEALHRYGYDDPRQIRTLSMCGNSYGDVRLASSEPRWTSPITTTMTAMEDFAQMVPVSHQVHPGGPRFWVDQVSSMRYVGRVDEFRAPLLSYIRHAMEMLQDPDVWRDPTVAMQPLSVVQRALRETLHLLVVALRDLDAGIARGTILAAEEAEAARRQELLQLQMAVQRAEGERDLARAALRLRRTPK